MNEVCVVLVREPLRLAKGDPAGAWLSAASGVAWLGNDLVVVDDASIFAAVLPGGRGPARSWRLFEPVQGHAHFSEAAGTKHLKPDLEILVPLPDGRLLALGSGARPARRRGARLGPGGAVEVLDLAPLYAALAARLPGELNLEGAVAHGPGLRLFQRGNGAGSRPTRIDVLDLEAALAGRPALGEAAEVALGELGGVPLGFTDACRLPSGRLLAALAAEATADAYADGAVAGSLLFDLAEGARIPLVDGAGAPLLVKLEGLCPDPAGPNLLIGVTDPDDPARPAELLRLELRPAT